MGQDESIGKEDNGKGSTSCDQRKNLHRVRLKILTPEHFQKEMLARRCPVHMEYPTGCNKIVCSMHHLVLMRYSTNDDGTINEAEIQHLNGSYWGGSTDSCTAGVKNEPYTMDQMNKVNLHCLGLVNVASHRQRSKSLHLLPGFQPKGGTIPLRSASFS